MLTRCLLRRVARRYGAHERRLPLIFTSRRYADLLRAITKRRFRLMSYFLATDDFPLDYAFDFSLPPCHAFITPPFSLPRYFDFAATICHVYLPITESANKVEYGHTPPLRRADYAPCRFRQRDGASILNISIDDYGQYACLMLSFSSLIFSPVTCHAAAAILPPPLLFAVTIRRQ